MKRTASSEPLSPLAHPRIVTGDNAREARRMDAAQAISLVVEWIRSRGLDYPTTGLVADRFGAGWSVYAPVDPARHSR